MTETPAPPLAQDAPALYTALSDEAPAGAALTTLHIGGSHTTVASGVAGSAPALLRTLDVGARVTATTCFAQDVPHPEELQAAAQAAQEAFAPLREAVDAGGALYTADAGVRHIALAAGLEAQPEMELTLAAVEQVFARLLGAAPERGAPPLPAEGRFAACLAILRGGMQALGFQRITICSDGAA